MALNGSLVMKLIFAFKGHKVTFATVGQVFDGKASPLNNTIPDMINNTPSLRRF